MRIAVSIGLAGALGLLVPACTPEDPGPKEIDVIDDEGDGSQLGECEARTNQADCEMAGPTSDSDCGWVTGRIVTVVDGMCEIGEEVGLCVLAGRGDDTCGGYSGNWYMAAEGGTAIVDASPCESVPGYMPCDAEGGALPEACSCTVP